MSNELVGALASVVSQLESAQESGKDKRRHAKVLAEAAQILADVEPELAEPIKVLAEEMQQKSGGKTDETNKLANRVRGLIAAEILPEDEQKIAEDVVAAYQKVGGSGGGARVNSGVTAPDFPFSIKAIYNGKEVVWEGQRSGHAYWNSLRHACRKYEQKTLKHDDLSGNGEWKMAKAAFENGEVTTHAGLFDLVRV